MEIKRCYDTLIGASVGENQLCNGESVTVPNGRKYYLKKSGVESLGESAGSAITGLTSGSDMVIDLTQMLGSTIADYIYSLETATAGAGIAKLREWGFCTGYTAFNSGSIESVEVTWKVVRGFNQWDEEWRNGYYNQSGVFMANSGYVANKNLIPVLPNTLYNFHTGSKYAGRLCFYDSSQTIVSTLVYSSSVTDFTFTTPVNAHYMAFDMTSSYGATYNHDICINLSSDRNGEYEPYSAHTYDLGTDTLRGIFKLDSNNNLYADGDRKASDGTVTRKYGVVDLGTLNWINAGELKMFFTTDVASLIRKAASSSEVFSWGVTSNGMTRTNYDRIGTNTPYNICVSTSGNILATLNTDTAYSNPDTFKTAMSGVMLVYELATPTTEQGDPFPSPQVCYPDGTEEFVTENGVPVGHETKYQL